MGMMGSRWVTPRGPREEEWEDADGKFFLSGGNQAGMPQWEKNRRTGREQPWWGG